MMIFKNHSYNSHDTMLISSSKAGIKIYSHIVKYQQDDFSNTMEIVAALAYIITKPTSRKKRSILITIYSLYKSWYEHKLPIPIFVEHDNSWSSQVTKPIKTKYKVFDIWMTFGVLQANHGSSITLENNMIETNGSYDKSINGIFIETPVYVAYHFYHVKNMEVFGTMN